jgi:hypothetical protein
MNELVGVGRPLEELAREFEASSQSIHTWAPQPDRDETLCVGWIGGRAPKTSAGCGTSAAALAF